MTAWKLTALAVSVAAGMARAGNTCTWTNAWDTTPSASGDMIVIAAGSTNLTWGASLPATVASWTQQAGYSCTATFQTVYGTNGFTNFTVSGDVTLNGGAWTHAANGSTEANRLRVTVGGNLLITNATITADGCGYSSGGPGTASYPNGAAYGGVGGGGVTNVYGSVVAPTNLGSASSTHAGGGAILLTVAGTTTVASAGMISANGAFNNDSWTGSGGSVFLTSGWLAGTGTFCALGGNGNNGGNGAGSGGRVAIILTGTNADFGSWNGTNVAYTGKSGNWASPGGGWNGLSQARKWSGYPDH